MRIVSIIGHKNAGKTTLVCALAHEFKRQKRRVGTIKHASHPIEVDRSGTDSWRHFHEGRADGVVVASPDLRVSFERRGDEAGPEELARRYYADMDVVIVEGFKTAPIPKIEVFRKEVAKTPLFDPEAENASEWLAIITDDHRYTAPCRVLHFSDTMWLTVLTAMVMEQAKKLQP
ncbi:MAG TPA: molybdopterin-guanine dinucleotide biosynthesis protein B [Gemmatimonadales bacterium]|jgi:molybdopterin-guanine dinucleotide biosynthesis protein B|nr:molybdopterin-guanine dinucleotide biosynthesis protein B [Gemmatimonadales bacterium]